MKRRPFHQLFGAALGTLACSLVVDTSEIDSGCGAGAKYCEGCVRIDDPAYGCKPDRCEPCRFDANGNEFGDRVIPKCDREVCVVETCVFGYGCPDCSKSLLSDRTNCGECGEICTEGLQTCREGVCVDLPGVGGAAAN
jgi:hypothetical protein